LKQAASENKYCATCTIWKSLTKIQSQRVKHYQSETKTRVALNLYFLKATKLQAAETILGGINKLLGVQLPQWAQQSE
jgi:hypothetical protein